MTITYFNNLENNAKTFKEQNRTIQVFFTYKKGSKQVQHIGMFPKGQEIWKRLLANCHFYSTTRTLSGEFLDESEFEIGNDKEDGHHDRQSQVVFPHAPVAVLDAQVVQLLLPSAPATTQCST